MSWVFPREMSWNCTVFDPPRTVLSEGDEIRDANGCGGGRAREQVGSPDRWLLWEHNAVEGSAGMTDHHRWTAHGLPPDRAIEVTRDHDHDVGIAVQGPAPEFFAIARVWGELSRRALTVEEALALLTR
jgi:hypothetical protein